MNHFKKNFNAFDLSNFHQLSESLFKEKLISIFRKFVFKILFVYDHLLLNYQSPDISDSSVTVDLVICLLLAGKNEKAQEIVSQIQKEKANLICNEMDHTKEFEKLSETSIKIYLTLTRLYAVKGILPFAISTLQKVCESLVALNDTSKCEIYWVDIKEIFGIMLKSFIHSFDAENTYMHRNQLAELANKFQEAFNDNINTISQELESLKNYIQCSFAI